MNKLGSPGAWGKRGFCLLVKLCNGDLELAHDLWFFAWGMIAGTVVSLGGWHLAMLLIRRFAE